MSGLRPCRLVYPIGWAALAFALLAGESVALELTGSAGGAFIRNETREPSASLLDRRWSWHGDLALAGDIAGPNVVQWHARGLYDGARGSYSNAANGTDGFGFNAGASFFTGKVVPFSLWAERGWTDYRTAPFTQAGSQLSTSAGAAAHLAVPGYPRLSASAGHRDLRLVSVTGDERTGTDSNLSLRADHSASKYRYALGYDQRWGAGASAEANSRTHVATLDASGQPSDKTSIVLNSTYFLRRPTVVAEVNPQAEGTRLTAGVIWQPRERLASTTYYNYGKSFLLIPGGSSSEQLSNGLNHQLTYRWTEHVSVSGTAAVSFDTIRRDAEQVSASSQSLGGQASWGRKLSATYVSLGGGGSIGLSEGTVGVQPIYSGTAHASASHPYRASVFGLSYQGGYAKAALESSYSQNVTASLATALGRVRLEARLLASGSRRDVELLGTALSRSVSLNLTGRWEDYSGFVTAGVSDGLAPELDTPVGSDGLFIPASFNTHNRYAIASVTAAFPARRLTVTLIGRSVATTNLSRPSEYENRLGLITSYRLGEFTLSADGSIWSGGAMGNWRTGNQVMVRLTRSFGWRF